MYIKKQNHLSISLVIPAYNEEDQLFDCLTAIAQQIDAPDEVIVVNNNSTDKTAEIVRKFPFVRLIDEPRQGLRYARNTGIAAASSLLIGRIDADSRLSPDWVLRARALFAHDAELSAATGPVFYHDMPLKPLSLWLDHGVRSMLFSMQRFPLLYGSNMVFRRSVWDTIVGELCASGHFFEDLDMTIHLRAHHYKIIYTTELIAGVSSRRMDDSPREFYRNVKLYKKTFSQHGQFSSGATGARLVFLSIYPLCKVLRQVYDPDTGKVSLNRAALSFESRPTSNT